MFCNDDTVSYSARIEAKANLPVVYFLNANPREKKAQVLLFGKQLSRIQDDSPSILKKSNVDRYMEGSTTTIHLFRSFLL